MTSTHRTGLAPRRRWLHTQALAPVALGLAVLALAAPGTASAHPAAHSTDTTADLGAMSAYRSYLALLTAGAPGAQAQAHQLEATVAGSCANALIDLSRLSGAQVRPSALTAFGDEVDADVGLAYISGASAALNRLGGSLDALSWSTPAPEQTTTQFVGAERALAGLAPSDLCSDAAALDAAPLSEPTTTRRFLARYQAAVRTLDGARTAFQALLGQFETPSESKLVAQINALAAQYASEAEVSEQTDADSLLSALGIS